MIYESHTRTVTVDMTQTLAEKKKKTDITPLYAEYQEFREKNTLYPHFGKKYRIPW